MAEDLPTALQNLIAPAQAKPRQSQEHMHAQLNWPWSMRISSRCKNWQCPCRQSTTFLERNDFQKIKWKRFRRERRWSRHCGDFNDLTAEDLPTALRPANPGKAMQSQERMHAQLNLPWSMRISSRCKNWLPEWDGGKAQLFLKGTVFQKVK